MLLCCRWQDTSAAVAVGGEVRVVRKESWGEWSGKWRVIISWGGGRGCGLLKID